MQFPMCIVLSENEILSHLVSYSILASGRYMISVYSSTSVLHLDVSHFSCIISSKYSLLFYVLFSTGVVEGMASGLITIAHRSGGPLTDIIGPSETSSSSNQLENSGVGFLASTVDEYANIFELVLLKMSESQIDAIRKNAIQWVHEKFSEDCFNRGWIDQMNVFGLESISA